MVIYVYDTWQTWFSWCENIELYLSLKGKKWTEYSHFESGEVAFWIIKVAGWKLNHSQFGDQIFLSAQDSSHCNVLKL